MRILVTGSSGLVGSALVKQLKCNQHTVGCLSRTNDGHSPFWNIQQQQIDLGDFGVPDAVIHLAGENIGNSRWTKHKKEKIINSRLHSTQLLTDFICRLNPLPKVFICASAIGYYGNRGNQTLNEDSETGSGFTAQLAREWEACTQNANKAGIRVVNIRSGLVLSSQGGVLPKMAMPAKWGVGSIVGDGAQYVSWISIEDEVNAICFILNNPEIYGAVNLVSPKSLTHRQFMQLLGQALHRPIALRIPDNIARLVFGEMADELLLASIRVFPKRLLNAGFQFKDTELLEVLQRHLTSN